MQQHYGGVGEGLLVYPLPPGAMPSPGGNGGGLLAPAVTGTGGGTMMMPAVAGMGGVGQYGLVFMGPTGAMPQPLAICPDGQFLYASPGWHPAAAAAAGAARHTAGPPHPQHMHGGVPDHKRALLRAPAEAASGGWDSEGGSGEDEEGEAEDVAARHAGGEAAAGGQPQLLQLLPQRVAAPAAGLPHASGPPQPLPPAQTAWWLGADSTDDAWHEGMVVSEARWAPPPPPLRPPHTPALSSLPRGPWCR